MNAAKYGVRYKVATGEILGFYTVAVPSDLDLQATFPEEAMFPVDEAHPIVSSQRGWRVAGGELHYTAPPPPAPPPLSIEEFVAALVDTFTSEINRVRVPSATPVNPDDITTQAYALALRRRTQK